ncbi:MAG: FAD-binding oxidoreductase [Dehalococcoidia bacterium]|nr:FAD-binding oxidoreductase [Dehalococcoidia bacterium]MDW8119717.1 FAD-binding oxidoreductase [Chloroflexota bacterium]
MSAPTSLARRLNPSLLHSGERLRGFAVDGLVPRLAVRPRTVEEVAQVLALAHQEGAAVVPWGGGTRMDLGGIPRAYEVALDLTGLHQPLEHSPANLTVRVGAGVTLEHLQKVLGREGQFLPLDPPLPHRATIGGTMASATYGPLCAGYGLPRDLVIGMGVVHADGTRTKSGGQVVKNVTGFEMHRLYTGSLGTLAVITEATFKVAPLPKEERTVVAAFPSAEGAVGAGLETVRIGLAPMAMEVLTDSAWAMVPAPATPLAPQGEKVFWLLVRFGGPPSAVARQEREALAVCERFGVAGGAVEVLKGEQGRALWRGVASWGWGEPYPPLGVRISCLPRQVVEVLQLLESGEQDRGTRPAVAIHASIGVVRVFWPVSPAGENAQDVASALGRLRERVHGLGGRMVVERAPVEVKRLLDPWDVAPETLGLHRALKAQFDPKGVLNAGRFVGGI